MNRRTVVGFYLGIDDPADWNRDCDGLFGRIQREKKGNSIFYRVNDIFSFFCDFFLSDGCLLYVL